MWARFSALVQTGPGPTQPPYNGYRVIPVLRRRGIGVNHPPPPSAEVEESVKLYLYSDSEFEDIALLRNAITTVDTTQRPRTL